MGKKTSTRAYSGSAKVDQNSAGKETFVGTIALLKERANDAGVILSDKDIAAAINISDEVFAGYMANDNAPGDLFPRLRSAYEKYLAGRQVLDFVLESRALKDPYLKRFKKQIRKK